MVQLRGRRALTVRKLRRSAIPLPVRVAARVGLTCALLLVLVPAGAGVARAANETVVSLTFNDAHLSQYTYARPVLQAHGMDGTFYVPSGWINKSFACCYTWWQADELYRDGNEIGGMGVDHKDLTQAYNSDWTQDYAYKRQQVCDDLNWLAGRGYDPRSFAYPAGAYKYTFPDGSTVQGIVRGCGYLAGRAVGGFSPAGPAYAETLPPKDAYAVRTLSNTSTSAIQLSTLQNAVTAAAGHGGGWVPLVFNQVCHQGDANYSTCMGSSKPIDDQVFSQFLDWLATAGQAGGAPAGTVVKPVRQAMGAPAQPPLPPRATTVSLTFDDGDASQYKARPMLATRGMHATFYVSSGNKTISWAQVTDLYGDGNDIGGHTVNHVDLTSSSLTYDQKVREVCDDRQTLAQRGYDPVSFAYPFGSYNATAASIVQSCGYQSGRRAGGANPAGPVYAETIPPADRYVVRTMFRSATTELQLSDLTGPVTAAASHGGGWVVLVFHEVCSRSDPDYSSCIASYKPVQDTTLDAFLGWLRDDAPAATSVKTVRQVMSGG
jgi:peptidoglycan/xylan/chitin deacetylase (PgdA/CDA1 family)